MKIQVLGPGCARCEMLHKNVIDACAGMGIEAEVEKVTDIAAIASMGVLMTPGLVVGEKVESSGHLLSVRQVMKILEKAVGSNA